MAQESLPRDGGGEAVGTSVHKKKNEAAKDHVMHPPINLPDTAFIVRTRKVFSGNSKCQGTF